MVGPPVGSIDGSPDGRSDGSVVGSLDGSIDGRLEGSAVGPADGDESWLWSRRPRVPLELVGKGVGVACAAWQRADGASSRAALLLARSGAAPDLLSATRAAPTATAVSSTATPRRRRVGASAPAPRSGRSSVSIIVCARATLQNTGLRRDAPEKMPAAPRRYEKKMAGLVEKTDALTLGPEAAARQQEFVDAAACGDFDSVEALLADAGLPRGLFNAVDKDGRSAFHYACLNDDTRLLRLLLADARVDVRLRSPRGDEGAHMAALYSSLEALKLLLAESGRCDLSAVNNYGETPLHLCAGSGDKNAPKTARLLLASGASLEIADRYGRGPMDVSKDNGETATLRVLEEHLEAHPELKAGAEAITAAHRARAAAPERNDAANLAAKGAIFGQIGGVKLKKTTTVVKTMFQAPKAPAGAGAGPQKASANATQSADGRRPLSKLIDFPGDVEAITGFLAEPERIDPAGADAYGLTALHKFASWGKVDLMALLLPHLSDAERRQVDPDGKTALHWAVEMASVSAVKALVKAGLDVEARDGKGHTVGEILDAAAPSGIIDRLKAALVAVDAPADGATEAA